MNCHSAPPTAAAAEAGTRSPNTTRTKNNITTNTNGGSSIGHSRSGPQPYEEEEDGGWNESTSTTRTSSATKNSRRTPMANVTNRRIEAQAIGLFKSVVGTLLNNCHLCTLYCDEQVRYETQQEELQEHTVEKDWLQEQYEIGTGSIGHLFTTATNINRNTTTINATSTNALPNIPPTDYTTTMGNWNNNNHHATQDSHENHTNRRTLSLATIPTDNTTAASKTNHQQHVQQPQTSSTIVRLS